MVEESKRQQIDYVRINRRLWMDGESVGMKKEVDKQVKICSIVSIVH